MRVLITGAAGFIGSHLADRLSEEGHQFYGVDNFETGRPDVDVSQFDVSDRHMLYDFANAVVPELIIHCAASYSDPNKWHRDTDTNVTGTINVINVARHHGAKLVYFQTALPPVSSYAISKIAAEQYIRISDVPHLIFRLANIYGPRNLSGPIPTFYKRISAGEPCSVVDTVRDMVYVEDLVDCVVSALKKKRVGTFDVCSGCPVSILSLFYAVAACFPEYEKPQLVEASGDDVMPVTSVHNWLLGWAPSTPFIEGVFKAVEWYREHGVEQTFTHLSLKG